MSTDRRYDSRLPTFSVLLPLYRESRIVPALITAMARLDYPFDRLEILFITEADDQMTRRALLSAGLPPNMRIVTVPNGQPRTKPRALNYALQVARGTLVAVFDAEDIPDADQLRRAANAFIEGGPRLACVQARLAIYNDHELFLTRQFALEYSALFSGLLPALGFLRLPVTLGGTSNHFRRDLLLKIGRLGPLQRDGRRRPRHSSCPIWLQGVCHRFRDDGGGAGVLAQLAGATDALDQGLDFRLTLSTCAARCVSGATSARGDLPAFN